MNTSKIIKTMLWILASIVSIYLIVSILMYAFQEKVMFFPEKLTAEYQYQYENEFEEINFKINEKATINALLFKAVRSKGIVYYLHGNAGSLKNWGIVAGQFVEMGYDVLIMDYRGYGKSTGKISERALFSDAQHIYNYIKKKYNENQIIVYGRSIGTGIAAFIASENEPEKLILESPYFSMADLAKNTFPLIPSFLIRYPLRTYEYIKSTTCPVYIFHGTNDEFIPYKSSLKLKELFKKGDELFLIQGGHHNDLDCFDEYHNNLREILE